MVWPAVIAGAAALGGSVINSVTGNKESKANRREARRQFDEQMDESVQRRVEDALKAGINPLAALGYNGGASPTIHAGGGYSDTTSLGNGIAQAGSIFAKALQDKQADDMEFDTQSKELDLESKRLENQILRNRLATMTNPGNDLEPPPSMDGEQLLFTPVYDLKGRPRLVINQNAIESDSDNPGYMSSIINAIGQAMTSGQISADGRIISPQLRMMLDDFYYNTTGHHIKNLEDLYISPTEAATATYMLIRGVS